MTDRGSQWSRRVWWAAPALVGAIGALGVAAVVMGPPLADSVTVPAAVNVGDMRGLTADQVTVSPPAARPAAPKQHRAPATRTPAPGTQPKPRPTEVRTTPPSTPKPVPTRVVAPQRPVVESQPSETPEPGDDGGGDRGSGIGRVGDE